MTESGSWSIANTSAPSRTSGRQLAIERVRQRVHAALDLLHVDVRAAEVLAQHLDHRVVHVRLDEVHDRVVLDRAVRPAAEAQELVQRVLVVVAHDLVPGGVALGLDHRAEVADGLLPQLVRGPAALGLGQIERQARGVRVRLRHRHPLAADVDQALRVAHHERAHRQPELVAVRERQVVGARDAHGARLGVQPRREGAQRVDPAADPVLGLEHDDLVALALELVRRDQAGQPRADDHDPLRRTGTRLEPALGDRPHVRGQRRLLAGRGCGDLSGRSWGRSVVMPGNGS